MAPPDPDLELVRRAAAGDRRAAHALVQARFPTLAALARRMLSDPAEAEDVAQEVFARAWRQAPTWREQGPPFFAWMRQVAVNLCLDRLRKRRPTLEPDAAGELPDLAPSPAALAQGGERSQRLSAALATLPDRQRAAITLFYFEELSNAEAAEALSCSVEALESLLARARRALKVALEDVGRDLIGDPGPGG